MAKLQSTTGITEPPNWVQALRNQGKSLYYTASGHVWLRFHKWTFMRFPPHDVAPVSKAEERELFFKAMAPVISHHYLPDADEAANSILYLCSDKEYDISKLSPNNRSKVRRGQKRLEVRQAAPQEIAETGYSCYYDTCTRNGIAPISENAYQAKWRNAEEQPFREMWAAFAGDEIAAIGEVWVCGKWAELLSTQSANKYLKDYSNHALFYTILHDLMHRDEIESVSYGLSSVQPNSKKDSLHHFKLSVNLEAIPVVRKIRINPFLRVAVNPATLAGVRMLERMLPNRRHILAARGALELIMNGNKLSVSDRADAVSRLEPGDAKDVAAIHQQVFPDYSSTKLGLNFCAELYRLYAETEGAFGFVVWSGGERVGFVAGGVPGIHDRINQAMRGKAAIAMLTRPSLVIETFRSKLSRIFRKAKPPKKSHIPSGEKFNKSRAVKLVLIGVKETARGTGAAAKLMQAFCNEAASQGFERVMLVVNRDNKRARAAYEKGGWTLNDEGGESVEYHVAAVSYQENTE